MTKKRRDTHRIEQVPHKIGRNVSSTGIKSDFRDREGEREASSVADMVQEAVVTIGD